MPNQPKTVAHTVRVERELWEAAAAEANRRGESLSEAVRRFLKRYSGAQRGRFAHVEGAFRALTESFSHPQGPTLGQEESARKPLTTRESGL